MLGSEDKEFAKEEDIFQKLASLTDEQRTQIGHQLEHTVLKCVIMGYTCPQE